MGKDHSKGGRRGRCLHAGLCHHVSTEYYQISQKMIHAGLSSDHASRVAAGKHARCSQPTVRGSERERNSAINTI